MKRCLSCGAAYPTEYAACNSCKKPVRTVHGVVAYAPDMARGAEGYRPEFYSQYAHLEPDHFWFKARVELIVWAVSKYKPSFDSFFEIGCGTGYVLEKISQAVPSASYLGSEIHSAGLTYAMDRLPNINFVQMDARNIPFDREFDCIGAFDVIEHIEEDEEVLSAIHRALNPDGLVLITVPQHRWLWSAVDEHSCHVRRYASRELHEKLERAGFLIDYSTSFVSLLLPGMLASRTFQQQPGEASAELQLSPIVNFLFCGIMRIEQWLIRSGLRLPIGGSRLVIARKIPAQ